MTPPESAPGNNAATDTATATSKAVLLEPGGGRAYPMGRISAVFKADGEETQNRYSVSEWWLEPHTQGSGPHAHAEDSVFYVIEGTMSALAGEQWTHGSKGACVLVPCGMVHDVQNRTGECAGMLSFLVPGDFEKEMPRISEWFIENPPVGAGA